MGQCPERWSHLSDEEVAESQIVVSDEDSTTLNPNLRPCGHPQDATGDHSLQASCSTDSRCITTNFYQCQHTEHEYPPETRVRCGNPGTASWACSEGGYAESTHAHILYCDGGHRFWGCNAGTLARHRLHGLSMSIHDTTSSGNADDVSSNENDSGGGLPSSGRRQKNHGTVSGWTTSIGNCKSNWSLSFRR